MFTFSIFKKAVLKSLSCKCQACVSLGWVSGDLFCSFEWAWFPCFFVCLMTFVEYWAFEKKKIAIFPKSLQTGFTTQPIRKAHGPLKPFLGMYLSQTFTCAFFPISPYIQLLLMFFIFLKASLLLLSTTLDVLLYPTHNLLPPHTHGSAIPLQLSHTLVATTAFCSLYPENFSIFFSCHSSHQHSLFI